jgi:hypothetical protein
VVWRDIEAGKHVEPKRSGKGGKISDLQSYLPASDPGDLVAHRWRKRLTVKVDEKTARRPPRGNRQAWGLRVPSGAPPQFEGPQEANKGVHDVGCEDHEAGSR